MTAHALKKIAPPLLSIMLLVACGAAQDTEQPRPGSRNVILFVGDGFGAVQMSLGVQYASLVENRELNIESLMHDGNTGYSLPQPFESIVIDSAAAATQLATDQAVRNDTLGLNPDGYPIETIVEWAHERGLGTGLVTNMRITHATPAAFAVHQGSRYNSEQVLMDDLLQERDVDVLLGGGALALVPAGSQVTEALPGIPEDLDGASIRDDTSDRVEEMLGQGYAIASDAQSLQAAAGHATKLLGIFSASHLPYVINRRQMNVSSVPTLAEMTMDEAREALARDEQGFAGTTEFRHYHRYPDNSAAAVLGLALARHTYVVWSTGEHTSDPVPTYGRGPSAEKLRGIYPNTHIYSVMRETLENGPL